MGVPELRSEVLELCDTLQAILAFNYHFDDDLRETLDRIRRDVPTAPARWLRQQRDDLREDAKGAAQKFRCKENPRKFAKWFKENSRSDLGIMLLSKVAIDEIFGNYTDRWINWASYAPHVLVYLDFTAESYRPKQFDWRLPEASLYEDMCVAYNSAVRCRELTSAMEIPVPVGKLRDCFLRTAVLSAFYFVEAYLNGVAFDYYSRNANNISSQDTKLLLEWDQQANREKWLGFKEKIQTYPKIILGLQHPPLTETSSAEMKILVGTAKEVRDAIVHQAPRLNPMTGEAGPKVKSFLHLRLGDATEIVDAAISLVRRLNEVLGQNGITLDWLVGRDSTGKFPEKAFL